MVTPKGEPRASLRWGQPRPGPACRPVHAFRSLLWMSGFLPWGVRLQSPKEVALRLASSCAVGSGALVPGVSVGSPTCQR